MTLNKVIARLTRRQICLFLMGLSVAVCAVNCTVDRRSCCSHFSSHLRIFPLILAYRQVLHIGTLHRSVPIQRFVDSK